MKLFTSLFLLILLVGTSLAQPSGVRWKKKTNQVPADLELFHATHTVNLPTAETIRKGEFEYEISHRFLPSVGTDDAYLGIDGPAHMRMALAYGVSSRFMATLGRSNYNDNMDLRFKYKAFQLHHESFPTLIAFQAGLGWNTQVVNRDKIDPKNFQYYGQLIANTLLFKKIGFGLIPSYLYNSHIYCEDPEYSFTLGSYLQYYVAASWSLFLEMNNTISGFRKDYDAVAVGVELETGGHFFKIFFTNSNALNTSQFLAGADLKYFDGSLGDNWRLGFNITRILKF